MRNTVLKIVCLVISLTFAFGVAELAVRFFEPQEVAPIRFWFDPQLGDIPVPNQKGHKIKPGVFDHTFSHNSLGFRGRNESRFEKHTDHRILFLGDSFTYGFGVNDDQTFAYLTEKQWLDKHLSVEVINAGCSGKGTDFDLKLFQVLGYKFKPDLTVLCFTANDFIDNERGDYFSVSPDGEISPKTLNNSRGVFKTILWYLPGYNWLVSWSQAANLLKIAGIKWFFNNTNPTVLKEGGLIITYPVYEQGYANDENKRLTNIYVKHIKKTVNKVGSSLMIVYVPVSAEVEAYRNNRQISHDETALTEIAKNHGEMTFSLTPALAVSAEPLDKLYFVGDGHWTALGHAVVAQCLSDQIARRFKSP